MLYFMCDNFFCPGQGTSFLTMRSCIDADNDGSFEQCSNSLISNDQAQLAGFESALRVKGACRLDSSVGTPFLGVSTLVLGLGILILHYFLLSNPGKKFKKSLKKRNFFRQ